MINHGYDTTPIGSAPPGNTEPPQKLRWSRKKKMLVSGAGLITVIVAAGIAGGLSNHSTTAPKPTASASHPATSAPAATQPPSVSQQMTAWFNGGGGAQLKAIGNDTGTLQTDMQAYVAGNLTDGTTLQAEDATFQSDVQAAQANLPPAGVPGLRSDYNAALTYYNTSATDLNNAVIAANSGDDNGAVADVEVGSTALDNGNAKLSAATTDVNNYNNS
jgi:hypothetical protein